MTSVLYDVPGPRAKVRNSIIGVVGTVVVLGILAFVVLAAVCDSIWGLVAGAARTWLATSPARMRRLGGTGGVLMILMGAGLAISGRKD